MSRRTVVIILALLSGLSGELLAAISTTRLAGPVGHDGGRLGFPVEPVDLRWTLFAVVSIAAWAGGVLWTSQRPRDRRRGAPINVAASALLGIAVGLDHAVHADQTGAWRYVAFIVGIALPLFSSVMLHLIAHMTVDTPAHRPWWVRLRDRMRRADQRPANPTDDVPADTNTVHETAQPATARTRRRRRGSDPVSVPNRIIGRAWLRENWTPGMKPAEVRSGLAKADPPVEISNQEAHKLIKWAERELPAQLATGSDA